jgi:type IV secretion system protein VirB9
MDGIMKHALLFLFILFSGCASVDLEESMKAPAAVTLIHDPVIVERPVYIPQGASAHPAQGRSAVSASNAEGIMQPQDYEKAVIVYDYHRDFVYQVYCQPLRITDITLQPGEQIVDLPFISDSERWMVGAGFHLEASVPVQHVYIKPTSPSLKASLIINTNYRVYHLILMSYSDIHMPVVRFRYWENTLPQNFSAPAAGAGPSGSFIASGGTDSSIYTDPRYVSFNYRIRYGTKKPLWLPTVVYDDGQKTYISFPENVLQTEMPAVFENRSDIVNYRVSRNVMIIDKLVKKISVKLSRHTVVIEKKRGANGK